MKNYPDLMVDLETLSTNTNAVILEIGWTLFDRKDRWRSMSSWNWFPDTDEQVAMGFHTDADTIDWWLKHPEAYDRQREADRQPVGDVVRQMLEVWSGACTPETTVWAKGTHFDLPILRKILPEPWSFRNIHDLRTLKLIAGHHVVNSPANSLPHSALHDSVHQAREVIQLCSIIEEAFCRERSQEDASQG